MSFSRLSDIYGFRIITQTEEDCYRALGAIHQRWAAVPGRFKDYISQPKTNGYRSIHTTVSGRNARRVEVQIRTKKMHDVAETGVAAHWSYRDGVRGENPFAVDPARWIRTLTEQFDAEEDHDEFMEAVKLEMYPDQVFCFTPKGDVVKLPRGATPIDFAYAIHTRIGNAIVGAKIDHLRVPLWTRVKNGQSIEIITAEGQTPQPSWLEVATTGKAKSAIRRALREIDQERYVKLGFELARSAFDRVGKKASDKVLDMAAKQLLLSNRNVLLAHLGSAQLQAYEVVQAVYPELTPQNGDDVSFERAVIGLKEDQSFQRAPCCEPLPGERIVGITHRGRGVVVCAIDCETLVAYEDQPERWLDLHWQVGKHKAEYGATLLMTIANDSGVLGRICTLIGEQQANIANLEFIDRKPDFFRLTIHVELRDIEHLHSLMLALQAEADVASIERLRDPKRAITGAATEV